MTKNKVKTILKNVRNDLLKIYRSTKPGAVDFDESLTGWCAVSSAIILKIFNKYNCYPTFCANDEHAFLFWKGYYIDITLKQFNKEYPSVWFKPMPHKEWHHSSEKTRSFKIVWKNICKQWYKPIKLNDPRVRKIVSAY